MSSSSLLHRSYSLQHGFRGDSLRRCCQYTTNNSDSISDSLPSRPASRSVVRTRAVTENATFAPPDTKKKQDDKQMIKKCNFACAQLYDVFIFIVYSFI